AVLEGDRDRDGRVGGHVGRKVLRLPPADDRPGSGLDRAVARDRGRRAGGPVQRRRRGLLPPQQTTAPPSASIAQIWLPTEIAETATSGCVAIPQSTTAPWARASPASVAASAASTASAVHGSGKRVGRKRGRAGAIA